MTATIGVNWAIFTRFWELVCILSRNDSQLFGILPKSVSETC